MKRNGKDERRLDREQAAINAREAKSRRRAERRKAADEAFKRALRGRDAQEFAEQDDR